MSYEEDEIRAQKRRERIAQMKIEKEKAIKRQQIFRKSAPWAGGILLVVLGVIITVNIAGAKEKKQITELNTSLVQENETIPEVAESIFYAGQNIDDESVALQGNVPEESTVAEEAKPVYSAHVTNLTNGVNDEIISEHVIFLKEKTGEILAQKAYKERISPASMTKVLTLLVAAEQVSNLDDTFTITLDITDYCFKNDCSNAGFEVGEQVSVKDMLYGTILPSGADAALGLAYYISGSHEAFVELMNQKLEELGLSDTTHFTNCVGIYDKDHYSTVYDIAMIMEAARENELCREILNARTYTTSVTEFHPEGMILSNWFLRRIEDKDTGGEIVAGKTGFVAQSGSCAASAGTDEAGNTYICVTAGSSSSWRCIYDQVALYSRYAETKSTENR